MNPSPPEILAAARKYLGVRFEHRGRGLHAQGIDCAGLLIRVCADLGYPYIDMQSYGEWPDGKTIVETLRLSLREVSPPALEIGRVAVFCVPGFAVEGRVPQHIAIVSGVSPFRIIHAHNGRSLKKVVEHGAPAGWVAQVTNVFEFAGPTPRE